MRKKLWARVVAITIFLAFAAMSSCIFGYLLGGPYPRDKIDLAGAIFLGLCALGIPLMFLVMFK